MKTSILSFLGLKCLVIGLILVSATHVHGQYANWYTITDTDGTGHLVTYTGGWVAIGAQEAAGNRLTVQSQNAVWNIRLVNSDVGGATWRVGSSSTGWDAGGGKFLISNTGSSGTSAFAIDPSSNVGIGTVDPKSKLHVNGNVRSLGLYIGLSNTEPVPADYQLAVVGKAIAQEMVVKLKANWPDYVFADNYKLPPLLEVERYIREKKHLPGVPSAETVAEQGLSLGEMNAVLLKKVEELTLYVIDLKKEVEALKAKK